MNGKAKGGAFERDTCKKLSRWVSGGTHEDLFWRSAMSGGRATVAGRKGLALRRQAGDITAVSPEGHALTDNFYVECKHLRDIGFKGLVTGKGPLINIWNKTIVEARNYNKEPFLIIRQNNWPTLACLTRFGRDTLNARNTPHLSVVAVAYCPILEIYRFDDLLNEEFKAQTT